MQQRTSGSNDTQTNTVTFPGANSAGNLIVVAVGWINGSAPDSVSDSAGNTYLSAVGPTVNSYSNQIWYAANIKAFNSNTVTVHFPNWNHNTMSIFEYSGIATSSPLDVVNSATGSSGSLNTGSVTTTQANELIFASGYAVTSFSADPSYIMEQYTSYSGINLGLEDRAVTSTGTYSATFSAPGNNYLWNAQIATFKAASISAGTPTCGISGDTTNHVPADPDWENFAPPAEGQSYVDSPFGCTVTRLTNAGTDETLSDGTHPSMMNFYSTLTAVNASDTMVMIVSDNGGWRIKDINGNLVVPSANMPAMNDGHPVWDASNGSVFYYPSGNSLMQGTVTGTAPNATINTATLHTFSEYPGGITMPDAADLSQDGDHIAIVGQNPGPNPPANTMDIFTWSLSHQAKGPSPNYYTTTCTISGSITGTGQPGCIHKLLLSADNLLSIGFANNGTGAEQGVRLWNGSTLIHLQDSATSHYDHGYDINGNPITTGMDNSSSLAGTTNPCPSGWGLDVRQQNNLTSLVCLLDNQPAWHISYRGGPSQPWIALSFFDQTQLNTTTSPEYFNNPYAPSTCTGTDGKNDNPCFVPPSQKWALYQDEILVARVDENNNPSNNTNVYRLARARSRSVEGFWFEPHATISRDGKYIVFTSSMAYANGCPANMHVANECTDVYLIKVQ